jgi:glycosyltransferase involved in cell wall biosynthesis
VTPGSSTPGADPPGPARSILFLIPSLAAGGAERQLIGLAAGLSRAGWRVRVLTFYSGGAFARDLVEHGVAVESLDRGGLLDLPGFAWRLIRAVRRARPDILHPYLLSPNIASILLKPFVPRARIVWGVRASNMNLAHYGRRASLIFAVSCRLARFADLIICNSTSGLEHHAERGYPRRRMVMIPNGIDHERFAPDPAARRAIRAEWAAPDSERLVGLVGRIDPMKDHATFLRAARLVASERPDVRFVCVGHGPAADREALEQLTAELGLGDRVVWAGGRGDLAAVHNAFDLTVSSSAWGEGFPNVVAEAMATGVPCVVTDIGDSAAVVGDTGWVVPPGQPAELAAAMTAALANPAELARRGVLARERVVREFSEDRRDRTTAETLSRLVERARPATG